MAEKGDWILIDKDENVRVMTDLEVRATFHIEDDPKKPAREVRVEKKRLSLNFQGKTWNFGAQQIRILAALQHMGGGPVTSNAIATSNYLAGADKDQVTARLSDAYKGKLVTISDNRPYDWTLTDFGKMVVKELGPTAQKYNERG